MVANETAEFKEKTKKLAEVINTYGINSKEFENYRRKHTSNKWGLMYIYKKFGIKSSVFYTYIKPFIVKQMSRFSYIEFDDDLVIDCYTRMLVAHCGGYSSNKKDKNGNPVYIEPYVDDMNTITVDKWINFLITICRSTIASRDYHYNKHLLEVSDNERLEDIICNSKIEKLSYFQFSLKNFIFENSMQKHIQEILEFKPANNLFLNLINWDLLESDESEQRETQYQLLGEINKFFTFYFLPLVILLLYFKYFYNLKVGN